MRATYSPSTCGMHHMSLRQGLRSFSARRRRTVSCDRLVWSVSLTIAPAQLERPAGTALWGAGTGGCHQQGFFLAREFAFRSGTRLFAQRPLQIAFHEASLGPVYGRAAHANAPGDFFVAGPDIGSQQNLCSLELAGCMLAAAKQRLEFGALDLVEFDPIAYIHACLLERGTHEQLNRMAGVSPSKTFTPKQGQYLAFIHLYMRLHR